MNTQLFRKNPVRICVYLVCFALIGSFAPKLLPGWLAHIVGSWINLAQYSLSGIRQEGVAMVLLAVGYVRDAQNCIEIEIEQLQTEQDAFYQFAESVQQMTVTPSQQAPSAHLKVQSRTTGNQLQTVRSHYRETVMAVPHYEEEYDETLRENMTAEFSHDTATAVVDGVHCSPQLQRLLVTQARDAARRRADLLEVVESERDSLTNAYRQLRQVDNIKHSRPSLQQRPFAELVEYDEELHSSIENCERVLNERQQEIRRPAQTAMQSGEEFYKYIYKDISIRFPVLNTALNKIRELRNRRRDVLQVLITRR